jgi:2-keto-4-pentenoate hydratase
MQVVDRRLVAALRQQLRHRERVLAGGAHHVGWKLGMGSRERIGGHIAVGHLTSKTVLSARDRYVAPARDGVELHVDGEVCVELDTDLNGQADRDSAEAAIRGLWPALEFVDLAPLAGEPGSVVANNVFHLAVMFGETPIPTKASGEVTAYVEGEVRERGDWPIDIPTRIATAARILAAVGQRLKAGDKIITGSIVQVPVRNGDRVRVEFAGEASLCADVEAQIES